MKLSDVASGFDYGIAAASTKYDGKNKYIRITDIDESSRKYKVIDPVSPDAILDDKYLVQENDILLARTGASVGKAYLYDKKDGNLYFAGFLIRINIFKDNANFIFAQTFTNNYWKWVNSTSMRSGQPGINSKEYATYSFYTTSKPEQDKIANFIALIDRRIYLQNEIIDKLKSYKRGVLFSIFSDKSSNIKLDSLLKIGKAGGTPKSTTAKYYNGNIPFLNISDMTNQGKYIYTTTKKITEAGIENSSAWLVPKNSIILSMYASYGFVSINKIELATSQAMFSMVPNNEISYSYLYHYLNYLSFTNVYERMVSTGTQPNLNAEKIKNIPIYLPTFDKQNFITTLLDLLDDYIYKQEKLFKRTNDLKSYLLQKLFI